MRNVLSVDVEEWFCVSNFAHVIRPADWAHQMSRIEAEVPVLLDLLDRHRVHATFFVLGWVGERHPDLIKAIAGRGHEIATHGGRHQLVSEMTAETFRADLADSLRWLRETVGVEARGYRAPSFSVRRSMTWFWEALAESGIRYDSSIFPVVHDRYGEPDAPRFRFSVRTPKGDIAEIPLSTIRLGKTNLPVAGGGYLRLYPYAFTRWAIRRVNAEGHPAVVYVHPWEIDPDQPKPAVNRLVLLRHRVGMKGLLKKLDRLLSDFDFGSFREVFDIK